ncbi:solute carrier family 22 member 7 isoform X2 [Ambystoma mexicanum]|uniref:solute carrier family 22 member 7 isoform X2 n=1 Tax=Ambystoma mexicanum TaxID=8296 RepID=UPI0037E87F71
MKFEDLLIDAGGLGRFQLFTFLLLTIPRLTLPLHFLIHNFLAGVPPHRCALPTQDVFGNLTEEEQVLISIPRELGGTFSSCKMYREPQVQLLENSTGGAGNASGLQSCQHGWVYDHSQFSSTIATEWDLVCEQKRLNQASATFFFIGVTVGAILVGYLSDRYGRRTMLLACYVFTLVFGMAAAASVNYTMLAVFRSLSGVSLSGLSIITVALSVEWVDTANRTKAGILNGLFWSIGNMLLSLLAYLIRDWRYLLIVVTSPCILGIISIWWLPESARWLLSKGKVKEAHAHLLRCSTMNRKKHLSSKISTEVLSKIAQEENTGTNYSFIDLFRTPVMRKISLCTGVIWFGVALAYYGISLNITGFGLDIYTTHFIYGAIEVPAKLSLYIFITKGGRQCSQAWSLIITGFSIGINTVIPHSVSQLRTTIAILGKAFSEASFACIYLYTAELYPTVLRQNGIGYNAFSARIAVSVAPLILLLDDVWQPLPQVIYCFVAILCGLMAFCLPETLNVHLPETVKDVEEQGTGSMWYKGNPQEDIPLKGEEKTY